MQVRQLLGLAVLLMLLGTRLDAADPKGGALLDAAKQGNQTAVQALIRQGADVNTADVDGMTPLHWAAQADDLRTAALLIAGGANVNAVTRHGIAPLWLAALNGSPAMAEALLKAGGNAKATFGDGQTILMTAARTGNPDVVRAVVKYDADVDAKEGVFGETALMMAAAQNHAEAVRVLLEHGAAINLRSSVISLDMSMRRYDGGGFTALLFAAREGALDAARVLADAGADLDAADKDGFTTMIFAIMNGHYDVAAMLLEKGADPNAVDASGRGALYAAVDQNTFEWSSMRPAALPSGRLTAVDLVKKLLAAGADPNARLTKKVIPAKHFADGNPNLAKGATPFLKAASTGDVELMRILLDAGANPYLTNDVGSNALMVAAGLEWRDVLNNISEANAIEAIRLCMSRGLDVNAFNRLGQTAMHGAAMRGGDAIVKFLVSQGARVDIRDKKGRTPLDEALGRANTGVAFTDHPRRASTVDLIRQLLAQQTESETPRAN